MNITSGFTYDDPSTSRQNYVLKIKQNRYGLKQAAMNWDFKIMDGLIFTVFEQSKKDPCLFIKDDILCSIYLDDTIFFVRYQKIIDRMVTSLKTYFDLTDEGDADAFLGVKIIKPDDGSITMTQP